MRDRCNEAARIALSANDWKCFLDSPSGCLSRDVGNGLVLATLVGRISPLIEVGVDGCRVGVETCTVLMRFSCLLPDLGSSVAGGAGLFAAGVAGFEGGDDARLVDCRRDRAGSTRLAGVASAMLHPRTALRNDLPQSVRRHHGWRPLKCAWDVGLTTNRTKDDGIC